MSDKFGDHGRSGLLPADAPTLMGPMEIRADIKPSEKLFGQCRFDERVMRLRTDVHEVTQLQTFGHELTHTILWDSGLANVIDKEMQEAVCDAVGSWLARAMRSGDVVFPKK